MKIYTKKGDKGQTSLLSGEIVKKHNKNVDAYGAIDELNSFIGLLKDYVEEDKIKNLLNIVQVKLFSIGSSLSSVDSNKILSKKVKIEKKDIEYIEVKIDNFNDSLPDLKNFIIPGGNKKSSYSHVCRSICRRAERRISEINDNKKIDPIILGYINRLSDLFFVLSRYFSFKYKAKESFW
tara:strand:+ start:203 stop:742 length:540 start_codon:yes stop_codon:yes gene_type:complete